MKVHHSVTDGVGGMALLTELIDLERDPPKRPIRRRRDAARRTRAPSDSGPIALVRDSLPHSRRRALGIARRVPGTVTSTSVGAVRDPVGTADEPRDQRPLDRPRCSRRRRRRCRRSCATAGSAAASRLFDVSLDDLRRAGKAARGSLNDVFVAAVVGGLQRYHDRHGAPLDALRMTLPINLRTSDDAAAGNRFAPARFPVPATIVDVRRTHADARRDSYAVARRARAADDEHARRRAEPAPDVDDDRAVRRHAEVLRLRRHERARRAGPGLQRAARASSGLYAFAPPAGAAVNVSLISHCDTCCIGVVVDTTAVPDADVLVDCLREGFDEVLAFA